MEIDLKKIRASLIAAAENYFNILNDIPDDVRKDEKKRTGIQVLIREPGTRNQVFFSVGSPSEDAQVFAVEKAVRSHVLKDYASQNSSDPAKMEFAGSISVRINDIYMQASASGMKAEEDVALMIVELAYIFQVSPKTICLNIQANRGKLPDVFFRNGHYLNMFLGL